MVRQDPGWTEYSLLHGPRTCLKNVVLLLSHWIDASELWCWKRLLRVPWTARKSNQSTLKKINPEYSLEGLMLKLKFQSFGHLMQRTDSLEKTLILGKTEGRREGDDRGWDSWMASLTWWIWVWASSRVGDGQGRLACCSPWITKSWTQLSDWTELKHICKMLSKVFLLVIKMSPKYSKS